MDLRVSDLKQWAYCPRVVYWTRVAPVERPVTRKMEYGLEAHAALDLLEKRRTLREYGLKDARRLFHLHLQSESLGLSGTLDLCLETDDRIFPVEFKDTLGCVRKNHLVQLAAYAVLLEEKMAKPASRGFWVCIPRCQVRTVSIPESARGQVVRMVDQIRTTIETERMPAPADQWGKCADCEFLRMCGDRYR